MVKKSQLNQKFYKPGEIAKILNLHTRTIQNYCIKGILEGVFSDAGKRYIPHSSLEAHLAKKGLLEDDTCDLRYDAIYARVSTHKQKNNYMHKSTSYVVNQLVSNGIGALAIGYNKGWKQDIALGKETNQKFV